MAFGGPRRKQPRKGVTPTTTLPEGLVPSSTFLKLIAAVFAFEIGEPDILPVASRISTASIVWLLKPATACPSTEAESMPKTERKNILTDFVASTVSLF